MHANRTSKLVKVALLAAVIIVLASTPLGYIPLGAIKATTIHIPVILGSILLGWRAGALLGGLFGLTSLVVNTLSPSLASFVFTPFYAVGEISGNFWSLVVCFVPRILTGVVPCFVYRFLRRWCKGEGGPLAAAALVGSMVNTLLVMHLIYFFFGAGWGEVKGIAEHAVYAAILGIIGTQGVPEAVVAALLTAAVGKVLLKAFGEERPAAGR